MNLDFYTCYYGKPKMILADEVILFNVRGVPPCYMPQG
jgi:hypothetical protein